MRIAARGIDGENYIRYSSIERSRYSITEYQYVEDLWAYIISIHVSAYTYFYTIKNNVYKK